MSELNFAIAIVFPGAGVANIVKAATLHGVHIIDKEEYDAGKDYTSFFSSYEPYMNGSRLLLLFIYSDGNSILAEDTVQLEGALEKSRSYNMSADYNGELT